MVLLIDANIIIDVLESRDEFLENSSYIWKLCETRKVKGCISTLTFANIAYIMRKELDEDDISKIYKKLKLIFDFVDLNENILDKAVNMNWNDFEDAIQEATAENIHADYIITRNVDDFYNSSVEAISPNIFISDFCK